MFFAKRIQRLWGTKSNSPGTRWSSFDHGSWKPGDSAGNIIYNILEKPFYLVGLKNKGYHGT
jgi:hypothetical protein